MLVKVTKGSWRRPSLEKGEGERGCEKNWGPKNDRKGLEVIVFYLVPVTCWTFRKKFAPR